MEFFFHLKVFNKYNYTRIVQKSHKSGLGSQNIGNQFNGCSKVVSPD